MYSAMMGDVIWETIKMYSKHFYLEIFETNFNSLYNDMKTTEHGYNGVESNPYHMEGTILAHTEMVMAEVEKRGSNHELMLIALLHDVGKPTCMEDIHETKKRRFVNHEAVSTFMAKPILKAFRPYISFDAETILKVIALHGSLYNYITKEGIPKRHWGAIVNMFSKDVPLFTKVIQFYECDHDGRILESPDDISRVLEDLNSIKTSILSPKTLTVLVGPPRAGKSTWAENFETPAVIISRDAYIESIGVGGTYSEKWDSVADEGQRQIDRALQEDFNKALKDGSNIIIDMTNMSKKSRRKWIANAKDYHKVARVFIEDTETLLSRNSPKKTISRGLIESMQRRFVMPTYDEFDTIEINGD